MSIPQFDISPYGPMHSTIILRAAVEGESGLTFATPTFTGTVTLPAVTLSGDLAANVNFLRLSANNIDNHEMRFQARDTGVGLVDIAFIQGAADPYFGFGANREFKFYLSGVFEMPASVKLNPVSGVAGFSVVSTALTLGSLGSVVVPQSAANVTDALAGNVAGCIGLDLTNAAERLYFRGASWFYIAKTGGLSMTAEERVDPNGHQFELGDIVRLIVDRVNSDGSFHAIPYKN